MFQAEGIGASWKSSCEKVALLYSCSSTLSLPSSPIPQPKPVLSIPSSPIPQLNPTQSLSSSPLPEPNLNETMPSTPQRTILVRCSASIGTKYEDWVEGEIRLVLPTNPILGVPLTSFSVLLHQPNLSCSLVLILLTLMFV